MITFKISFILAFSLKQKSEVFRSKGRLNKNEASEKTVIKKNKNGKKSGKEKEIVQECPPHIFEVDKILGVAHVQYELIPNKCKYQFDVKCWGTIAKIFTQEGQKSFKTVIRNGMAWVPICLVHSLDNITKDEIKVLHDHIVKFEISNSAESFGKMAAADKSKIFFAYHKEADLEGFVDVFHDDPNIQKLGSIQCNTTQDTKFTIHPSNVTTRLEYKNNYDIIYDIIDKHCTDVEIECKDFVLPCSDPSQLIRKVKLEQEQAGSSAVKKSTTKNVQKPESGKTVGIMINVPAEVFFTDPNWVVYKKESPKNITRTIYILMSVDHLITRVQKLSLDPLIIKIMKLSNIPEKILIEMGFTSIYTTYNIPSIVDCVSLEKPIAKKIKFNESHIFFNDNISKLKLIEFLQTKKFYVEIYGIKATLPEAPTPLLFGKAADDKYISKIKHIEQPDKDINLENKVLLAVCAYDVSSIVQNIWDFKEKGQCHSPQSLYLKCMGYYEAIDYSDVKNFNQIGTNFSEVQCPLLEEVLLNYGTTLKVEVYLMAPQTASLILLRIPNTFKRLMFFLYSWQLAKNVLIGIMNHNDEIISQKKTCPLEELEFADIITGFMIDNGSNVTIFVEGLSTGFILSIENITTTNYEVQMGKFFFNTDTVFERRLYSSFLWEGLSLISLRLPLFSILRDPRIYLKGNLPYGCLEALKKLYLLSYCASYKSILQSNLLPKPNELLSLNIEWGVPLMVTKYYT